MCVSQGLQWLTLLVPGKSLNDFDKSVLRSFMKASLSKSLNSLSFKVFNFTITEIFNFFFSDYFNKTCIHLYKWIKNKNFYSQFLHFALLLPLFPSFNLSLNAKSVPRFLDLWKLTVNSLLSIPVQPLCFH